VVYLPEGRQAARAERVGPVGARGWLWVSMCQIASASLRAISTRAIFGAALLAQPLGGALVVLAVDGVPGGVGGRLGQRPAQELRAVLGERAAMVGGAGLVDARGHGTVSPQSFFGDANRLMSPISAPIV
jgi:hypothetical protein